MAKQNGFSMIELMIVLAIISILSAIAIPHYLNQTMRARRAEAYIVLRTAYSAQTSYFAAHDVYAYKVAGTAAINQELGLGQWQATNLRYYNTTFNYLVRTSIHTAFVAVVAGDLDGDGDFPPDTLFIRSKEYDAACGPLACNPLYYNETNYEKPAGAPVILHDDLTGESFI